MAGGRRPDEGPTDKRATERLVGWVASLVRPVAGPCPTSQWGETPEMILSGGIVSKQTRP
jgi:hypothetical protein